MRSWLYCPALAAAVALVSLAIYMAGGFRSVDDALHDLRMRSIDLPASGELVVVEIDAQSLRRLGQWPWPRGHHAMVLDRLLDAGATRVAFDVSFSSPSDIDQDDRLADAMRRAAGRLVLPIFRQPARNASGEDVLIVDRPLARFARNATLASINVRPDEDGIVRRMSVVDRIDGQVYPGMATALRDSPVPTQRSEFLIDFSFDPDTIPRQSFADILIGQFDPAEIERRTVLIGATAIELGDVLAVPRWGNLAGPLVIASGFESLHQGRAVRPLDSPWFVFALCLVSAMVPAVTRSRGLATTLIPAAVQVGLLLGLALLLYAVWALMLNLAPLIFSLLVGHGVQVARQMRAQGHRIAEQKREVERRQALLRSVVDTSIDAVVIADQDGIIQVANPACLSVFGWASDAMVGREATSLIDPSDRIAPALRAMSRDESGVPALQYPIDVVGVHRNGSALELELALACIGAAQGSESDLLQGRYYIYVFRDVSEQRRLEAMRRLALESQIEAERSKSDFLSTASHELRTPLNHIKGFTSLLGAGVGGDLSEQQRAYLGNVETAADNLLEIVIDILSYAENGSDTGDETGSPTSVTDLVAEAHRKVATLATERDVTIEISDTSDGCLVCVDRDKLVRATMHVLRNAVQFSAPNTVVTVTVAKVSEGDQVRIAIGDSGPGMTNDEIERILRPFGQLERAHSRHHGGLGIGLNLARKSLDQHRGRLAITSELGEGTTVILELPTLDSDNSAGYLPAETAA